jgi:hypothetical protein
MKLVWIGAFVLVFASVASLISNRQSGRLIEESWASVANVLPDAKLNELLRAVPAYATRIFGLFPEPFRVKFAAKTWQPVELMVFRSLLVWHLTPAFAIVLFVGFIEGSWARSNQKTLIKMYSPMRFSLALATLGFSPVLALLWITAPVALSATVLVLVIGAIAILGTRNLIVNAPTQF